MFENVYQKIEPADLNQPQSKIKKTLKDLEKTIRNYQNYP